jgi:hypothetical protein
VKPVRSNARLVTDPPPYRPSPTLRGPRHLLVEIDGVVPAAQAAREPVSPGLPARQCGRTTESCRLPRRTLRVAGHRDRTARCAE